MAVHALELKLVEEACSPVPFRCFVFRRKLLYECYIGHLHNTMLSLACATQAQHYHINYVLSAVVINQAMSIICCPYTKRAELRGNSLEYLWVNLAISDNTLVEPLWLCSMRSCRFFTTSVVCIIVRSYTHQYWKQAIQARSALRSDDNTLVTNLFQGLPR